VDHRRRNILVAEQFMNCPDVIARFQQMRGERMAKTVATDALDYSCLASRLLDRALKDRFVHVVPAFFAGLPVFTAVFLMKDPVSSPFGWRIGVFSGESKRHHDAPPTLGKIPFVYSANHFKVFLKRSPESS
jgi:hypothetical protein